MDSKGIIWTIGHSTRPIAEFIDLLKAHDILQLVDIRRFPGSRRYPHFNKEELAKTLQENNIDYMHMEGLGGRRQPLVNSVNVAWRNASFRGYADHMQSEAFKEEIARLEEIATLKRTVYMCSEAPWWKCHRSLVSDFLKVRGWTVYHIMNKDKITEHPFTSPARAIQGHLFYDEINPAK